MNTIFNHFLKTKNKHCLLASLVYHDFNLYESVVFSYGKFNETKLQH
jgi:hypothetical protein